MTLPSANTNNEIHIAQKQFSIDDFFINPLLTNSPFLYPLKTYENFTVFWCFQEVEKEWIGNKWVKCNQIAENCGFGHVY